MVFVLQCRKLRSDAVGNCVTKKGAKTCVLKYCRRCLLTRFGFDRFEIYVFCYEKCVKALVICIGSN